MTIPSSFIAPYINGNFVSISKPELAFSLHNPAAPKDILAAAGWNKELIDPILTGLHIAQKKSRTSSFKERLAHVTNLRESADEIKSNMMLELARSRVSVDEEWNLCESLFSVLPTFCKNILATKKDVPGWEWHYAPLGLSLICANIALPVYSLLCGALPALLGGNAVCLVPSSHCLLSASLLASSFHQAAFPPGLVQIVYGNFDIVRRLVRTHQFHTILYTGEEESLEQLRHDTSAKINVRLVLCGGGKNAAYVTKSADIDAAVQKIIYGMCLDAGQRLEATGLAFAHSSIFAEFQDKFVTEIKKMPIGVHEDLSRSDAHVMGALCTANACERYLRFQGIAAREADETLRWGKSIDNQSNGYFVSPGVHVMKPEKILKSIYASNAFFGPDICLIPVEDSESVTNILDQLESTRCLGVHTQFAEEVEKLRKIANIPTLLWNNPTTHLNPLLPSTGRGSAGNSHVTGVGFLLSTVYPQTLNCQNSI